MTQLSLRGIKFQIDTLILKKVKFIAYEEIYIVLTHCWLTEFTPLRTSACKTFTITAHLQLYIVCKVV